jgi:ABC-type transport system involved in cytochrome c biogenesis permease subunit
MTQVPADRGDTMAVLRAVLDTQFWLATHVVCVTLGYATTLVAGLFGLMYVIRGVCTRSLTPEVGKELARMTYGTICFGLLFSFFGTVLGGLWADDSWGRFWGWDPKENGALIIVLWNALVLHARWGGMVKDRGLAVLAIGGNIVTAWSWFGVNELSVGLHNYGFTEGALFVLGTFVLSQLIVIVAGCLPKQIWASSANVNAAA